MYSPPLTVPRDGKRRDLRVAPAAELAKALRQEQGRIALNVQRGDAQTYLLGALIPRLRSCGAAAARLCPRWATRVARAR